MTVSIEHRSTDNNDSDIEWEVFTSHLAEMKLVRRLGNVDPIKISPDGTLWIPKGVHAALVGELAASLADLNEPSFQVLAEQCRRPTPVAVCLLVQNSEGQILAVSRKKDFHKPESEWRFGLPGGKVDPGEDHIMALVREVREETGCKLSKISFVFESICPGQVTYVSKFYTANISGDLHTDEPIHIRWVPPEVLMEGPFAFSIGRLLQHLSLSLHGS